MPGCQSRHVAIHERRSADGLHLCKAESVVPACRGGLPSVSASFGGRGSATCSFLLQGDVFRARWRGTQVAVKRISHESKGDTNLAVSREVMVGQVIGHPNLVGSCHHLPADCIASTLQDTPGPPPDTSLPLQDTSGLLQGNFRAVQIAFTSTHTNSSCPARKHSNSPWGDGFAWTAILPMLSTA